MKKHLIVVLAIILTAWVPGAAAGEMSMEAYISQ